MKATRYENEIQIADGYLYKESIKEIHGRRYDADTKLWFVPLCEENTALLQTLGAEIDVELIALYSKEVDKDEEPICKMPIKVKPYKHQINAFNFAMRLFGGYE